MNNNFYRLMCVVCVLSACNRPIAQSDAIIGARLDTAFRAIEPCGDNYDSCMDTLQSALLAARAAAQELMLPKTVAEETRQLVGDVFAKFDDTINKLKGDPKTDRWHRPADKTEMQNLYTALSDYPAVFKTFLTELQKTTDTTKIPTTRTLTKNLALSVEGCLEFLDKILKKLDHYIHEPEEAATVDTTAKK